LPLFERNVDSSLILPQQFHPFPGIRK
jgi:hypothetical protein